MSAPRNLVNLSGVAKGYGSRVGARRRHARRRRGRPHRRRRPQRRRQVDAAAADRRRSRSRTRARSRARAGVELALLGQGDELDADAHDPRGARRRPRRPRVGGRPRVPRRARRAARRRRAAPLPAGHGHADRAALGRRAAADRAREARCSTAPSCCCSTSRRTTSTSRASTGSPRHLAARRGALVVVTHDRWFLDAVCTATWEVADGGVHQYEGGYAAYVLARAERERAGGGARGAPPAPAAQGARVAAARAAGAHVQAEVPHRGRRTR